MRIKVPITRRNIISEVLHSHKELPRYKHALEVLFCVVNGYEPIDGYAVDIEDLGYQELYTKTLKKIEELKASLPKPKDSGDTSE